MIVMILILTKIILLVLMKVILDGIGIDKMLKWKKIEKLKKILIEKIRWIFNS